MGYHLWELEAEKMAISPRKVEPNLVMDQLWLAQIINPPSTFLANTLKIKNRKSGDFYIFFCSLSSGEWKTPEKLPYSDFEYLFSLYAEISPVERAF
jgi:hypothetical protein